MKKLLFILFGFIFLLGQTLFGNIINIPDDYPTIQQGIDASVNGDTVLVQPGTYVENINYNGKNIAVASLFLTTQDTTYISQTVINGDSSAYDGGGIYCLDSSPTLESVTITGNSAGLSGGGICCYNYSNPIFVNCILWNDTPQEVYFSPDYNPNTITIS